MFKRHYSSSQGNQNHEGLPMSLVSVNVKIIYTKYEDDVK